MAIILTLIILCIIVILHEWGHFIVAKKCGIWVQEFGVGMGPKLFGFQVKETLYTLRLFPVGGFCRMADDTDEECEAYGKVGFNDASVYKRFLICLAGPVMNFVLAFFIMFLFVSLTGLPSTTIAEVSDDTPAHTSGLEAGDKIISLNGTKVHTSDDIDYYKALHPGDELNIIVNRNGENVTVSLVPELINENGYDYYMIGIMLAKKAPLFGKLPDGMVRGQIYEYVSGGYWQMISLIKLTAYSFEQLFTGGVSVRDLSGPIGVTAAVDEVYDAAVEYGETRAIQIFSVFITMSNLTALLSANLGVINLLPLPALDGGHLIIYFVEFFTRKRIPPEKEGKIHLVGFALMMAFGIFIAINDVIKLIS